MRALAEIPQSKRLITYWPVLTEAAWLLRSHTDGLPRLMRMVIQERVWPVHLDNDSAKSITRIAETCATLGVQLADACLVHIAEREGIDTILTVDRKHFGVYRIGGTKSFQVVPQT